MKKNILSKSNYFLLPLALFINFEIRFASLHRNVLTLLLSLIMFYAFFAILFTVFKRFKRAILIVSIISYIIIVASYLKIEFSGEPFYFSDIFYYNDVGEILTIVKDTFFSKLLATLPFLLFHLAIIISVIIVSSKIDIEFENKKRRIIVFCSGFLVLLVLYMPNRYTNQFMLNFFYEKSTRKDYNISTDSIYYYKRFGHLAGMHYTLLDSRVFKPETYNKTQVNNVTIKAESTTSEANAIFSTKEVLK